MWYLSKVPNFIKNKQTYLCLVLFLGGLLFGLNYDKYRNYYENEKLVESYPIREGAHRFDFINPLLACELSEKLELKEIKDLSRKLQNLEKQSHAQGIKEASIYVRDLRNGRWAEANANLKFSPGSLMKVPIMIAVLKYAEANPDIFLNKFQFHSKYSDKNKFQIEKPSQALERGRYYSVEELLYRLIVYSDNNAASLLFDSIQPAYFDEVFKDLGIDIPPTEIQNAQDYIGTKSYSLFLRILYNSTYLTRVFSDKALHILSLSDYKKGLVGGLPPHIISSHKFGESVLSLGESSLLELHDCGIVYLPDRPYLLCVMTKSQSWTDSQEFIKKVSELVYKEMSETQ